MPPDTEHPGAFCFLVILFAAQQELHVREGPLLPDVPHHLEQLFQQRSRLGVEQIVVFAVLIVLPRGGVGLPAPA